MTNADAPFLATTGGAVKEQKNPFTGKVLTLNPGYAVINTSHKFQTENHGKTTFNLDSNIQVHSNIFISENWQKEP